MKNTDPSFILAFLSATDLKAGTVFKAFIKLNLNGELKEFEGRIYIKLHDNYFELDVLSQDLKHITRAFDSRFDIFTFLEPRTLNIGGITRDFSYKASITPCYPQT